MDIRILNGIWPLRSFYIDNLGGVGGALVILKDACNCLWKVKRCYKLLVSIFLQIRKVVEIINWE